ncbi:hypothetical protein BC835DRAFT_1395136 [Cytidiella melzeri]|nr:hypothetical protein BC835DRAFT_1395136 [Cytidiella melzeri]
MRLSTSLVLFVAIVTGALNAVTVSGVPYPPSSHNLEGPASTGEHTVLSSTPTATLKHDYARSQSIATAEEVEAVIAEKRAPPLDISNLASYAGKFDEMRLPVKMPPRRPRPTIPPAPTAPPPRPPAPPPPYPDGPPPPYLVRGQRSYTMAVNKRVSSSDNGDIQLFAQDGENMLNTGRKDKPKPNNPLQRADPAAV